MLDLGPDASERRKQRWHSGYRTKREAERGLNALLSAQDSGTYVTPQRITVGEYLTDRWLPSDRGHHPAYDAGRLPPAAQDRAPLTRSAASYSARIFALYSEVNAASVGRLAAPMPPSSTGATSASVSTLLAPCRGKDIIIKGVSPQPHA